MVSLDAGAWLLLIVPNTLMRSGTQSRLPSIDDQKAKASGVNPTLSGLEYQLVAEVKAAG
jgi:hypothetical protein